MILAVNNFANPIQFLCGAVQAASRLGAEESAKLCVQYLAPIMKNRQFNYPPLALNQLIGATTRPNELTFSEDWLRPDYIPPGGPPPAAAPPAAAAPAYVPPPPPPLGNSVNGVPVPAVPVPPPLPAEKAAATSPNHGLLGLMMPAGAGS